MPVLNVDFLLNSRTVFRRPLFNSYTLMTPVAFDLPPIATNFRIVGTHFVSNTVKFSVFSMCENIIGCCCLLLVSMSPILRSVLSFSGRPSSIGSIFLLGFRQNILHPHAVRSTQITNLFGRRFYAAELCDTIRTLPATSNKHITRQYLATCQFRVNAHTTM